jgi:multidrug transporter EmrE-like cation transporter
MPAMLLNIGLLTLYVAISSCGLLALKTASGPMTLHFAAGLILYAIGFAIWYGMLTRLPLSVAFPIAAGSLVMATQIVGWLFLDERLQVGHLGGIALILAGIAVVFAET